MLPSKRKKPFFFKALESINCFGLDFGKNLEGQVLSIVNALFMHAMLGHSPSYTWNSVLAGEEGS